MSTTERRTSALERARALGWGSSKIVRLRAVIRAAEWRSMRALARGRIER